MGAVAIAHFVIAVPSCIVLVPVAPRVAERHKTAHGDIRDARIVERGIAHEARDSELGPGVQKIVLCPVVQRVRHQIISAKAKIVDDVLGDDVSVANRNVPVVSRAVGLTGGRDATAKDVRVLPIVADEQANLVPDIVVNAFQRLIR